MNSKKTGLLLFLFLSANAQAQSLNQRGIDRLNQDVQTLWSQDGLSMVHDAAMAAAQKLVGVPHAAGSNVTVTITSISSLTLDCPGAPGVQRLDGSGLSAAIPLSGTWHLNLVVGAHAEVSTFLGSYSDDFHITIDLSDLHGAISATLDSSDPSAPKVIAVNPPTLSFTLHVSSTNTLVNILGWLSSSLVNDFGGAAISVGAQVLAAKLDLMASPTPSVLNAGGPGLQPIAIDPAALQLAAGKLGDEIEAYRTPFGPIIETHFDKGYSGTWADSLANPSFDPGKVDAPHAYGDSGEMTGHYLAALAFQYAVTHDATAQARGARALDTLRTLLTMRHDVGVGDLGSMNRSIMPISFIPDWERPKPGYTPGQDFAMPWHGDQYFFTDYASRDEYMGLFYGLAIARDLFDDPNLKASAQASIEMALDYLLANDWTWRRRDGSLGERWQGVLEQQYAWILAGYHGNPAKYQSVHDQYQGFCDLLWVGFWTSVMDPFYSYYKFQLGTGSIYSLLRLETDPVAWQRAYQSVAILRHYIGHHLNPLFNNVYLATDPSSKTQLGGENANLLTRWLNSQRRRERIDIHNDPTIEQVDYTPPVNTTALPGNGPAPTIKVAKYPLPPEKRVGSGFMWSVSPVQLDPGYPANPDANIEGESLDFVLPYWQARYYGAIAGPRKAVPIGIILSTVKL
jgi:hypothetical protein